MPLTVPMLPVPEIPEDLTNMLARLEQNLRAACDEFLAAPEVANGRTDAVLYGIGYTRNGKHVPITDFFTE